MISRISQNGQIQYGIYDYVLDSESDVKSLPKLGAVKPGSQAFVIETSQYYMLDHAGNWRKVNLAVPESGGGGDEPGSNDHYDGGEVYPDENYDGGEVN